MIDLPGIQRGDTGGFTFHPNAADDSVQAGTAGVVIREIFDFGWRLEIGHAARITTYQVSLAST
jgi:hypothetical protein